MKLLVTYPDVERLVVDWLTEQIDEDVTVGVGVPVGWVKSDRPHVQVSVDGTPAMDHPVGARSTVRLVAWAAETTEAKRLANLAHAHLLAHPGGDGIAGTLALTGIFPAHDSKTGAELASVTTRVTVRGVEVEPSGS